MLLLVSSLLLCACANGLAVGEDTAAPAPHVYTAYADVGRYAVDTLPRSWAEASKVCKMLNGHLAFPETADELVVLKKILVEYNITWAHIGFHDHFEEGKYITVHDQLLSGLEYAAPWAPRQPDGAGIEKCGILSSRGFEDAGCGFQIPSICEERDPLSEGGSLGYERIGTYGLFKMVLVEVSWPEAVRFCRDQGSHLWIANSAAEVSAVYDHYPVWAFWGGAHHLFEDRFFMTIFDETLEEAGYSTWANGGPFGNNTERPYVLITYTGMEIHNGDHQYFMCEYNPPY